jgi:hypothetical protein
MGARKVLSIEDVLLWRLRGWVHWHHASGFQQAAHLLVSDVSNAGSSPVAPALESPGCACARAAVGQQALRSKDEIPTSTGPFGVADAAGRIAVVGGVGNGGLVPGRRGLVPQVDLFDPAGRRWTTLPGMRTPRHHFAIVS